MTSRTGVGTRRRLATRYAAAALATATAATLAGTSASPAVSAIGTACPQTFPVSSLAKDQPVSGLTVSQGTEPGEFSGKVLGVLEDGIMPGIDMIMVRLGSDTSGVDKRIHDVGIWSGMSGSPVYAEDGRLIGAVSYGLSYGPSTVAGVTPAADMRALLAAGAPTAAPAKRVAVPERIQARVVTSGAATEDEVESGLSQLKLPFGMSGLGQRRFLQVAAELDIPGVRMMRMGTASAAAGVDASSLVAGGNLAAALSYGDISYAGVGTATMVCGDEVVGFGHPMMWAGPTGLSLHAAEAIYVQEDPAWAGFKVANIGGPVGTIDQDRMAGIAGFVGALPETSTITSHVTSETGERTGQSFVNVASWVPDVALSHLLTNEDRVFDGVGKGSGTVSYVIVGKRQDGTPFSVTRSDMYADQYDLTWATAWEFYMTLARLEYNGVEDITIDSVSTDSDLSRDYVHATIEDVSVKRGGQWISLSASRRLALVAGTTAQLRVDLLTTGAGASSVRMELPIRQQDAGRRGWLEVSGGNSSGGGFGGRNLTVDKLLERIEGAVHNDDIVLQTRLDQMRKGQRTMRQEERTSTGVPVDGGIGVRLRIVR
jgi:hypothetical protein